MPPTPASATTPSEPVSRGRRNRRGRRGGRGRRRNAAPRERDEPNPSNDSTEAAEPSDNMKKENVPPGNARRSRHGGQSRRGSRGKDTGVEVGHNPNSHPVQGQNASAKDTNSSKAPAPRGRGKSRRNRKSRGKARADVVAPTPIALPVSSVAYIDQNHHNPISLQNENQDASEDPKADSSSKDLAPGRGSQARETSGDTRPDKNKVASNEAAPEAGPSDIVPYRGGNSTRHSPSNPVILSLASLDIHPQEIETLPPGLVEIIALAATSFAVCPDGPAPKPSQAERKAARAVAAIAKVNERLQAQTEQSDVPKTTFLSLPPEIRYQIYAYVFKPRRVEVIRTHNKDGTSKRKYRLYNKQHRPREIANQIAPTAGRFEPTPLPLGLLFSNKQVYGETLLPLYMSVQFIFNNTKAIAKFLKQTRFEAQSVICHVEINQVMYNEPRLSEFRYFKLRSDMGWYVACETMALRFRSLRVLHIDLRVFDWPIRLEIGERWSVPLIFFRRHGGVEYADIKVKMAMFGEERLAAVGREMERKVMGEGRWVMREQERVRRRGVRGTVVRLII